MTLFSHTKRLGGKVFLALVIVSHLHGCQEPLTQISVKNSDYQMQVVLFEDSTFIADITEADSGFKYLGQWSGDWKTDPELTLSIQRKNFQAFKKPSSILLQREGDRWLAKNPLPHPATIRKRTIYDKDQ